MHLNGNPVLLLIFSGCMWGMIGYRIGYSIAPIRSTRLEVGWLFLGGVLAAPFIGLLLGAVSRKFASLGPSTRIAVALADLYLAAWLFLLASSIARLLFEFRGLGQEMTFKAVVLDPVAAVVFGLTYTGYVLLLWPMSYMNHSLVARAWKAARMP